MRRQKFAVLCRTLCLVFVLASFGVVGGSGSAVAATGMTVSGNRLLRDGSSFVPRGFNSIGLLAPSWCSGAGATAASHFGQAEMDAAKAWNANVIRFQVSQRGLADPTVAQGDRDAYLARVEGGVALARSNGLVVILSLQDQANGCGSAHPLPSDQTRAAWQVLAPAFTDDQNVMFELFNEPQNASSASGWAQWANGGSAPLTNQGEVAVGHQQLVNDLRGLGANNVLIADGAAKAEQLQGLPQLTDTLSPPNIAYGAHPYFYTDGSTNWDIRFGYLTSSAAVIATEWNYKSNDCGTKAQTMAPALLAYLQDHRIGVLGHALDVAGARAPYLLMTPDWTWTPTECGTAYGGAGQVLKTYFAQQSGVVDTTPPSSPPGFTASPTGGGDVSLTWDAASDDVGVVAYQVRRDGVQIGQTSALSFVDTTVAPATTYTYTLNAVDAAGNVGPGATAQATTAGTDLPPSTPSGVAAQVVSPTKVRVTWSAASDDHGVASYRVLRDGAVVGTVSLGLTYTDTTVTAGRHTYAVVAVDTVGQQSPASVSSPGSTATVPAPAPTGLTGTYFAKNNLTTPKLTRVDKTVNFTWGTAAPAASVPKDNFSVRWTGEIIPLHNEAVTFAVTSDQGVRMWVNGQQIINDWTAHTARTDKATVSLTNNQAYSIQIEYYELTGSARMQLKWSTPTIATQVVPAAQLLSK